MDLGSAASDGPEFRRIRRAQNNGGETVSEEAGSYQISKEKRVRTDYFIEAQQNLIKIVEFSADVFRRQR
jgi:hypothetical protein